MLVSFNLVETILSEGIICLVFVLTCVRLAGKRFAQKKIRIIYGMLMAFFIFLQILFYLNSKDIALSLTRLPLSLYLPAAVSLYLLSGVGFFRTSVIWSAGFLVVFLLKMLYRILRQYHSPVIWIGPVYFQVFAVIGLIAAAALLLFLVYRYLGRSFAACAGASGRIWMLIGFPILLILLLFSFLASIIMNVTVWILLFFTVLSIFLVLLKILSSYAALGRMKEQEEAITYQMQVQREEYGELCRKIEMGRNYRHDMRHHLSVLEELTVQGKLDSIRSYLGELGGKLSDTEQQMFCENPTVNAVLSSWAKRARELHCELSMKIFLPKDIPYDDIDICMVLANALENAVNACQDIKEEEQRCIRASVDYRDGAKLLVLVENPCGRPVAFDRDGFPYTPGRPAQDAAEHGIGLRSIKAIVEKYNGFFLCECEEGIFRFRAALFRIREEVQRMPEKKNGHILNKLLAALAVTAAVVLIIICGMAGRTQTFLQMPVWEEEMPSSRIRSLKLGWGNTLYEENVPEIEDPVVDGQVRDYLKQMRKKFLWHLVRKYNGNVGMETDFRVMRDDERLFTLQLITVLNVGGSVEYSSFLTVDKSTGESLTLSGLFLDGSDYIGVISEEILRQMSEQVQAGKAKYFIPGDIWREEECFKSIDPDQEFYINEDNRLVIVFDEYEVAPGNMGRPEFVLDTEALQQILRMPSVLGQE